MLLVKLGSLPANSTVEVVERQGNRVRTHQGWTSVVAKSGTVLLEPVSAAHLSPIHTFNFRHLCCADGLSSGVRVDAFGEDAADGCVDSESDHSNCGGFPVPVHSVRDSAAVHGAPV